MYKMTNILNAIMKMIKFLNYDKVASLARFEAQKQYTHRTNDCFGDKLLFRRQMVTDKDTFCWKRVSEELCPYLSWKQ